MSVLAAHLNDLAQANSDGLLNDDEYRALRQDLFERYANENAHLVEKPLIPSLSTYSPYPSQSRRVEVSFVSPPRKESFTQHTREASSSANTRLPASSPSPIPSTTTIFKKSSSSLFNRRTSVKRPEIGASREDENAKERKGFIPRMSFSRKMSDMTLNLSYTDRQIQKTSVRDRARSSPTRRESPVPPMSPSRSSGSSGYSRTTGPKTPTSATMSSFPGLVESPSRPSLASYLSIGRPKKNRSPSFSSEASGMLSPPTSHTARSASSSSEIFDDSNLDSAASIRSAISNTQAEQRNLVEMFDQMESRAGDRLTQHQKSLGIEPSTVDVTTPPVVQPSSAKSPAGSLRTGLRKKSSLSSLSSLAASSVSNLSAFTKPSNLVAPAMNRSRSASVVEGPELATVAETESPTSRRDHKRQMSLRSVRSADTLGSMGRRGVSKPSSPPLGVHPDEDTESGSDMVASDSLDTDQQTLRSLQKELNNVRRKKDEVVWRYDARVEYLRARLKGAELAEKVARR